ncbi:ATP-binding protein [Streptomyces chartreusis]|uniref:ATP-binding protein n=1 Tax=Streptomyces chartreusis TaxID=1969 RepID=UPI0038305359
MDTAIDEACRALHLPTNRRRVQEMAGAAMRQRSSYKDFLADLLEAECAEREERRKQRLVRDASFPRPKRLEDFDFEENPNVTPELVGTLSDPASVKAGQPLCLIGDSGTGKSHLLIGIGTAMAEAGLKVRYTTTVNLVNELAEAADEKKLDPHHRPLRPRRPALPGRVRLSRPGQGRRQSCCSRSLPSARRGGPSRSRRTPRSQLA